MKEKLRQGIARFRSNEYLYLILAFLIPVTVMYVIYVFMSVWPFGKYSCMALDLNGQYVYYFEKLRDVLTQGGSLLYSWERSLGGEFMGIFAYYLASPLSWIVCLFPKAMMTEAILCLLLLKMGLSGLCFGLYLHHRRPGSRYGVVLFSVLYAMSAYGVIQSMNTMWIDAMYLLPLLAMSLERLADSGRFRMFTVVLALTLLSNFYIGYMMAIFSVLYYLCYYFSRHSLRRLGRFAGCSLKALWGGILAVMLSAVILLPAWYSLGFGKTDFQTTDYSFFQRFDFLDFFAKLLPGSYDTVRPEGLPVVYCGMLALLLLPVYFFLPDVKPRRKIAAGVLLVLLIMSMNMSTADIFWHGMSKPNWLNYRYSFAFSFVMLVLAWEAFRRSATVRYRQILSVGFALVCMIVVLQKFDYEYLSNYFCIWISLGALGLILASYYFVKNRAAAKRAGVISLGVVIVLEMFAAGLCNLSDLDDDVRFGKRDAYVSFMRRVRAVTDQINENDGSLFRMEKTLHRKVNDPLALDMKGISHSTSTLNAAVIKLLQQMGYSSRSHWSKYMGGNPVGDSLLGIKYIIEEQKTDGSFTDHELEERLYHAAYETENDLIAYENPYALGILYTAASDVLGVDFEEYTTPFERLNALVTAILGEKETVQLFRMVNTESTYEGCSTSFASGHKKFAKTNADGNATVTLSARATTPGEYFLYIPSDYPREVDLTLNGAAFGTYFGNETRCILDLGTYESGQDLILQMKLKEDTLYLRNNTEYIYYLDEALFNNVMLRLAQGNVNITSFDDTHIAGTFESDAPEGLLFTTIPYDAGWRIQIDGKTVAPVKTLESLLAVDITALSEGEHTITMRYLPDCLLIGAGISLLGVLLFVLTCVLASLYRRRKAARAAAPQSTEQQGETEQAAEPQALAAPLTEEDTAKEEPPTAAPQKEAGAETAADDAPRQTEENAAPPEADTAPNALQTGASEPAEEEMAEAVSLAQLAKIAAEREEAPSAENDTAESAASEGAPPSQKSAKKKKHKKKK